MEKLLEILEEIKPGIDWMNEESLFDDEILDSFDIIAIINEVNDTFDIEISVVDAEPENFNSAEAMWNMIQNSLGK